MSEPTVYDKIVAGELPSCKIWEDDNYLAILTRWPNTPGFSVVFPKKNPGDNYLDVADQDFVGVMEAAKKAAAVLRKAFKIERVALVLEGEGVPHLHVKLIPMHGDKPDERHEPYFSETYHGFITTTEGPEMSQEELEAMQKKILEAAE